MGPPFLTRRPADRPHLFRQRPPAAQPGRGGLPSAHEQFKAAREDARRRAGGLARGALLAAATVGVPASVNRESLDRAGPSLWTVRGQERTLDRDRGPVAPPAPWQLLRGLPRREGCACALRFLLPCGASPRSPRPAHSFIHPFPGGPARGWHRAALGRFERGLGQPSGVQSPPGSSRSSRGPSPAAAGGRGPRAGLSRPHPGPQEFPPSPGPATPPGLGIWTSGGFLMLVPVRAAGFCSVPGSASDFAFLTVF